MTTVIINPGSGLVADADTASAITNITHFASDLGTPAIEVNFTPIAQEGSPYTFVIKNPAIGTQVHIAMPSGPLEKVRDKHGAEPEYFPRIFVDGDPWLWAFAVKVARDRLLAQGDSAWAATDTHQTERWWDDPEEPHKAAIRKLARRYAQGLEEILSRYIPPSAVHRVNTNLPAFDKLVLIEINRKSWVLGQRIYDADGWYEDAEGWYWTDADHQPIEDEDVTAWADLPPHTSPQEPTP